MQCLFLSSKFSFQCYVVSLLSLDEDDSFSFSNDDDVTQCRKEDVLEGGFVGEEETLPKNH